MKLRDILAVPFWVLAMALDWIATTIGGVWTSKMFLEQAIRVKETITGSETTP